MRIPSQFNEDNLYRRGRASRAQSGESTRRLVRLVVVLLLVVMVMQQAAKPGVYAVFFSEPDKSTVPEGKSRPPSPLQSISQGLPGAEEAVRVAAQQIAQSLDRRQQRNWTTILASWNQSKPFTLIEPVAQELVQIVTDGNDLLPDQQMAFVETFKRFASKYARGRLRTGGETPGGTQNPDEATVANSDALAAGDEPSDATLSRDDRVRLIAVLESLDDLAIGRVKGESVVQASDFDAYYRFLDQAPVMDAEDAISISVVPLIQQPDVYRGRLIRVTGQIALVEEMEAAANPFGIGFVWKCWIKPDTGADRPIVFAVAEIPKSIAKEIAAGKQPEAKLIGRYLKAFPYRSQKGADVAPLAIGRIESSETRAKAEQPPAAGESRKQQNNLFLAAGFAFVFGVAIAVLVMWRTSVSAKRTRDLRLASQESQLELGQLDRVNSDAHAGTSDEE